MKIFLEASVKLKHHYNLLNEENSYKYVNKTMDSSMLKPVDVIVFTESVELKDIESVSQSFSLSLIDLIANQKKRILFAVSFTGFESSLSSIDWISKKITLENSTPVSLVNFDLSLLIDPRLLNEFDPQPIILLL